MNKDMVPTVPTPNTIAGALYGMADTLRGAFKDGELALTPETARDMIVSLRSAASNVGLLFSLEADEEGHYNLKTMGHVWMLADLLKAGDMVPSSYKSPEQVAIGLMKAGEIGVEPISGLGNIMIINNRPSVWGDLAQALVQRTGAIADHFKEEVGERPAPGLALKDWPDSYGWRVGFSRVGQGTAYVQTYTVADAKRAGLWMNTKKQPWITDPSTMLFNRARARALRDGFSDKLFGMGIIEEQRDFAAESPSLIGHSGGGSMLDADEPVTEVGNAMPNYEDREPPQEPQEGEEPEPTTDAAQEQPEAAQEPATDAQEGDDDQPSLLRE